MSRIVIWFTLLAGMHPELFSQSADSIFYGDHQYLYREHYVTGFIAGTNGYGDRGKYQRFDYAGDRFLTAARIYFAVKEVVNSPDTIWIVIRDKNADGSPGTVLSSVSTTTDKLDTNGSGNLFFFDNPPRFHGSTTVPASLFLGFEWNPACDDTFAVYADQNGYGENAARVWEYIAEGSGWRMYPWVDPHQFTRQLDADLWIVSYLSSSATGLRDLGPLLPSGPTLGQNFPNPFNPTTIIPYTLPHNSPVTLAVYNELGQLVAMLLNEIQGAGQHEALFSALSLPSGAYFYRLTTGGYMVTRRLVVLK